ncbi:CDP-diacylglycerol--glycerol-3-phosphate 3-phosphatidyltransferase [Georgenia deserti]|uniref:CDP-diacylglycerol--glycerol-3-phosphate 3-phosphatidyltransferase n=1 Tax=Georgenia deserti TaxID=2093781 RepID=A0ABW4L708_9MICO
MTQPAGAGDRPVPLWNIANILTMVRIVLVPVFVLLFLQGTTTTRLVATGVFAVAALTDKLDGTIARRRGLVTDFGKLADPIADKALVISALLLLSIDGLLPWWATVVIIVRELGITALREVMKRRGAIMAASSGGKTKTVLQITFLLMLLVPWADLVPGAVADAIAIVAFGIMLAAVAVTVITGVDYVVKAVQISARARHDSTSRPAAGDEES